MKYFYYEFHFIGTDAVFVYNKEVLMYIKILISNSTIYNAYI